MSEPTSGGSEPSDPDQKQDEGQVQNPGQAPDRGQDPTSGSSFNDPTAPVWVDDTAPIPAPPSPPVPPKSNPYATPASNPYATPPSNPYATPPSDSYATPPPAAPYGQPTSQYGQPQPGPQYPAYGQVPYSASGPPEANVSAIVLTIFSTLGICNLFSVIPLVLGIVALTKNAADPQGSRRLAKIGWFVFAGVWALALVLGLAGLLRFALDPNLGSDFNSGI